MKRRKRSALSAEDSAYTRRSQLWAELKRLAPENAAKLSYTPVSTEQVEPMVEEAKKETQGAATGDHGDRLGVVRHEPTD